MSDGSDTFEEVLAQARERGIGRVAFTNHDTTRGLDGAVVLGERFGVQVTGGIEVSAYDFKRDRKVHVLGLGLCEDAPALVALCGPLLERRNANSLWQLDRLVEAGYQMCIRDRYLCLAVAVVLEVVATKLRKRYLVQR